MNISMFDILGPVMIGPSSSHTAGHHLPKQLNRLLVLQILLEGTLLIKQILL